MKKKIITIGIDASRAFVDEPEGPEYYSWHIIKNLAEIDPSIRFTHSGSQVQIKYTLYLRPLQKPNFRLPRNFTAKNIGSRYFWIQVSLAFELIRQKPDILFIPAYTLSPIIKALLPHLPIVVTIHGLEGKYLPQSGSFFAHIYRNWSIGWAVRLATHLIAVSNDTKSDIINTYRTNTESITVIHEGVDTKKYKKGLKNGKYLLFVGTLQPRKNLIRLIKAFSLIKNKKIKLILAGKYGWLYEGILKAPGRFGVSDRVIFTGRVDENTLLSLYRGATAFVLPSITEGFGLPILEAQAVGIPIVSSYGGALREIAGKGAIFVNPYKTQDIKRALELVLQNKKIRHELVKEGNLNVKKYSWKKSAYNTLNVIFSILNRN